jgi:hypothetical protein
MVSSHRAQLDTNFTFATGIACTLFVKAVGIILRKRRSTGKLNLPLVVPSVLIFILATVVSLISLGSQDHIGTL